MFNGFKILQDPPRFYESRRAHDIIIFFTFRGRSFIVRRARTDERLKRPIYHRTARVHQTHTGRTVPDDLYRVETNRNALMRALVLYIIIVWRRRRWEFLCERVEFHPARRVRFLLEQIAPKIA